MYGMACMRAGQKQVSSASSAKGQPGAREPRAEQQVPTAIQVWQCMSRMVLTGCSEPKALIHQQCSSNPDVAYASRLLCLKLSAAETLLQVAQLKEQVQALSGEGPIKSRSSLGQLSLQKNGITVFNVLFNSFVAKQEALAACNLQDYAAEHVAKAFIKPLQSCSAAQCCRNVFLREPLRTHAPRGNQTPFFLRKQEKQERQPLHLRPASIYCYKGLQKLMLDLACVIFSSHAGGLSSSKPASIYAGGIC
eukprot:1149604-Pelagomonas_calceolata.AAC.9